MALIIEDGSGVTGANSYVTSAEIRAYAEARGLELPEEEPALEVMAVQAFDYVEALTGFKGYRSKPDQRTQWPRTGVVIDCYRLPGDSIPWQLKEAQAQAAYEATLSDLIPNPESSAIKKEKVDVLETEYQDSAPSVGGVAFLPKVDVKLRDLMGGSPGRIRVSRA